MLLNLYYKLPIVLISLKVFGENKKKILILEKNSSGRYFYVKQGAVKRNQPRMVSLLFVDETYTLEKSVLSDEFLQQLEMEERELDNDNYFDRLTDIITGYKSINFKRKKKLIIKPAQDETKKQEITVSNRQPSERIAAIRQRQKTRSYTAKLSATD